ncbi:GNAT family N-acetyltransferase [Sulfuriflexus mobilis]|uniref:GNAT family N-acetyltransferase n=1 Tax=Sulfuriflexus mobilis TaxID=1811807 RepID=UPI0015585287|nr:GNAT family N-acetyltransferase [Sulfuriflexus mobilis]
MKTKKELNFHSVEIKGPRVLLRPISTDLAEDIFREFTNEITRYMVPASPDDIGQIDSFIARSQNGMDDQDELVLAITRISDGEFLGVCGLHGKTSPDTPELGVWLKKSAHGRGLGREAVYHLAKWAQENILFSYMLYPVDKDNIASRKIAEYLGGDVFREGSRKSLSGRLLNEVVYKITRVK